jgi:hypothetical protein
MLKINNFEEIYYRTVNAFYLKKTIEKDITQLKNH